MVVSVFYAELGCRLLRPDRIGAGQGAKGGQELSYRAKRNANNIIATFAAEVGYQGEINTGRNRDAYFWPGVIRYLAKKFYDST